MEIRRLEQQTRTLIKEAKDTQELFKTLEQDDGPSQPDEPPNSKLLCNIAYEILIKYSTEEAEGLSHFLKQLQATKGKEEVHLEALENVQISDWDHYLTALQKINTQQTTDLNALSFQRLHLHQTTWGLSTIIHCAVMRSCESYCNLIKMLKHLIMAATLDHFPKATMLSFALILSILVLVFSKPLTI